MMSSKQRKAGQLGISAILAVSLLLSSLPLAMAGPGDTNSVNTGTNMQPGTYYNTADGQTVFTNPNGDLRLDAGTIYGRQVDGTGNLTGAGGNMLFNAPNGMIHLGGNIDVSGTNILSGQITGPGGTATFNSATFYQAGNIFANGSSGGTVNINVGAMSVGPNARIEAMGMDGAGGNVNINATGQIDIRPGAIIDTSGAVIGTYNTNVIKIEGGLVNLDGIVRANGMVAGQQGGKVTLVALNDNVNIGSTGKVQANGAEGASGGFVAIGANKAVANNGEVSANGGNGYRDANQSHNAGDAGFVLVASADTVRAINSSNNLGYMRTGTGADSVVNNGIFAANGGNGFNGHEPTNGGNGGYVDIKSQTTLTNNGYITANGGNGGTNALTASGPVITTVDGAGNTVTQQTSLGQDGGHGGNAGAVILSFKKDGISNNGLIAAVGGNGGDGQKASSDDVNAQYHYATGGNGGNGGTGGWVEFFGTPSQAVLNHTSVNGGSGGSGGSADPNNCGCAGGPGTCGGPGQIVIHPETPTTPPPETPPKFPPPYPKENGRIGDNLPPGVGQVLSYNRSIFLARAPLPIIQKRKPKPVETPPPPVVTPPANPKPKPVPPKRRVPVRGYW